MAQRDQKPDYLELQVDDYSSFEIEAPHLNTVPKRHHSVIHYILVIFSFTFASVIQPFFLLDKSYYNINQDNIGTIISLSIAAQLVTRLLTAALYKAFSEKVGRKTIVLSGAVSYLLSCLVVSLQNDIFPGFIIGQVLLANSTALLSTIPFPDHQNRTEGKAAAFSETFVRCSALFACVLLKLIFISGFTLNLSYIAVSNVVFVALVVNSFGLGQNPLIEDTVTSTRMTFPNIDNVTENGPVTEDLQGAIQTLTSNGWVMTSFVVQILASATSFVFLTFMTIYVLSLSPYPSNNNIVTNMQIVAFSVSLLCNMVYGALLDNSKKRGAIVLLLAIFAIGGGGISFALMSVSRNYSDMTMMIAAGLMGATLPGLFVIASYLGIKNFPPQQRRVLIGLSGLFGQTGYFLVSMCGGFLYDYWRKDGLFIMCSAILFVGLLVVVYIYKSKISGKK